MTPKKGKERRKRKKLAQAKAAFLHVYQMQEVAERVAMRQWLEDRGIKPCIGCSKKVTTRLMSQVAERGGNPLAIMARGRQIAEDITERSKANRKSHTQYPIKGKSDTVRTPSHIEMDIYTETSQGDTG